MPNTVLLPPATAVRMTWALTAEFSGDDLSRRTVELVRAGLEDIRQRALKHTNPQETEYVVCAIATMDAARRSLETVYKGRELSFAENEKLRTTYLDAVRQGLEFGNKAQDAIKALPAMVVTGAGGSLGAISLQQGATNPWWAAIAGLGAGALGYFINQWIVNWSRKRTQALYVDQDYERTLYYDQYIRRVSEILTFLHVDLDRLHANTFGGGYAIPATPGAPAGMLAKIPSDQIVSEMLAGVRPTFCVNVHKHKKEGKITPGNWTICETGSPEAIKDCRFFP